MPELPEIETIVRGLRPVVTGRRIVDFDTRQPKAINLPLADLRERGRQGIRAVERRGKSAILRLETDDLWLHLGVEGRLLFDAPGAPLPTTVPIVAISLDDGSRLRLERIFMGHAHLLDSRASAERERGLGVDPLGTASADWLRDLAARKPDLGLKAALMDQALIAGVGNAYSDEALHRARLHLTRKLGSLDSAEVQRLWADLRAVLSEAIEAGGDESYTDPAGRHGTFTTRVHGRRDCADCGGQTIKQSFGGRSGYFCPACQGGAG